MQMLKTIMVIAYSRIDSNDFFYVSQVPVFLMHKRIFT